ncbi:type VI secretion system-associated protein VasI [Pseudomonas entomophila]|uniref:type VI secretion system-associated protein VasI n=1 Tax=Pseudomonas entomophila TaxID=312306 RepID=UPI0023D8C96A|nr:type VI secretion system-associated protein VasI [Pseudomonas entomophila]MDF0729260.1 type VI secretion system-associated protein VasI [Pseudomonas entomophila]
MSLLLYSGQVLANPARDCPQVVSNLERLACFDQAAGTPVHVPRQAWSAPEQEAPSLLSVMVNEARRAPDDLTFTLSEQGNSDAQGQKRLVISAPAIAATEPRPFLAISCIENISRLQLLIGEPIDVGRVTVQLRTELQSTAALPWQVMENGQVLDAGRGLPAIEKIKALIGAHRIHVVSDDPVVDGLTFDAQGLDPLIEQARAACRW